MPPKKTRVERDKSLYKKKETIIEEKDDDRVADDDDENSPVLDKKPTRRSKRNDGTSKALAQPELGDRNLLTIFKRAREIKANKIVTLTSKNKAKLTGMLVGGIVSKNTDLVGSVDDIVDYIFSWELITSRVISLSCLQLDVQTMTPSTILGFWADKYSYTLLNFAFPIPHDILTEIKAYFPAYDLMDNIIPIVNLVKDWPTAYIGFYYQCYPQAILMTSVLSPWFIFTDIPTFNPMFKFGVYMKDSGLQISSNHACSILPPGVRAVDFLNGIFNTMVSDENGSVHSEVFRYTRFFGFPIGAINDDFYSWFEDYDIDVDLGQLVGAELFWDFWGRPVLVGVYRHPDTGVFVRKYIVSSNNWHNLFSRQLDFAQDEWADNLFQWDRFIACFAMLYVTHFQISMGILTNLPIFLDVCVNAGVFKYITSEMNSCFTNIRTTNVHRGLLPFTFNPLGPEFAQYYTAEFYKDVMTMETKFMARLATTPDFGDYFQETHRFLRFKMLLLQCNTIIPEWEYIFFANLPDDYAQYFTDFLDHRSVMICTRNMTYNVNMRTTLRTEFIRSLQDIAPQDAPTNRIVNTVYNVNGDGHIMNERHLPDIRLIDNELGDIDVNALPAGNQPQIRENDVLQAEAIMEQAVNENPQILQQVRQADRIFMNQLINAGAYVPQQPRNGRFQLPRVNMQNMAGVANYVDAIRNVVNNNARLDNTIHNLMQVHRISPGARMLLRQPDHARVMPNLVNAVRVMEDIIPRQGINNNNLLMQNGLPGNVNADNKYTLNGITTRQQYIDANDAQRNEYDQAFNMVNNRILQGAGQPVGHIARNTAIGAGRLVNTLANVTTNTPHAQRVMQEYGTNDYNLLPLGRELGSYPYAHGYTPNEALDYLRDKMGPAMARRVPMAKVGDQFADAMDKVKDVMTNDIFRGREMKIKAKADNIYAVYNLLEARLRTIGGYASAQGQAALVNEAITIFRLGDNYPVSIRLNFRTAAPKPQILRLWWGPRGLNDAAINTMMNNYLRIGNPDDAAVATAKSTLRLVVPFGTRSRREYTFKLTPAFGYSDNMHKLIKPATPGLATHGRNTLFKNAAKLDATQVNMFSDFDAIANAWMARFSALANPVAPELAELFSNYLQTTPLGITYTAAGVFNQPANDGWAFPNGDNVRGQFYIQVQLGQNAQGQIPTMYYYMKGYNNLNAYALHLAVSYSKRNFNYYRKSQLTQVNHDRVKQYVRHDFNNLRKAVEISGGEMKLSLTGLDN